MTQAQLNPVTRATFLGLGIKAVREYALDNYYFTVDELRAYAEATSPIAMFCKDGRAWGAVIRKAQAQGLVRKHGIVNVDYRHRNCHSAPRVVWETLI
jgi:hypothetical protein